MELGIDGISTGEWPNFPPGFTRIRAWRPGVLMRRMVLGHPLHVVSFPNPTSRTFL